MGVSGRRSPSPRLPPACPVNIQTASRLHLETPNGKLVRVTIIDTPLTKLEVDNTQEHLKRNAPCWNSTWSGPFSNIKTKNKNRNAPTLKTNHFRTIISAENAPVLKLNHFRTIISAEDTPYIKIQTLQDNKRAKHPSEGHCCVSENQTLFKTSMSGPLTSSVCPCRDNTNATQT